ncbi:nuclear transport factor 2 family protein [Mycolicibacterium fallax]|uniref:Uncharacterized protein n=1 Tax=Mycolicibacterium fallax TaxID=1793 RepID=A0A1X1RCU4_MYCFA|nr:nuclear transport factor 2 family protein [Mycolicibacterium fallax]ORV03088.1 hypothetical protein AWC04_10635 [Mycolicibacterium fallax]BBY98920.1 hypothetical protein MFAL_23870 [Mycolicibacterium fallax]
MTVSEIATVLAWHDALNAGDLDTLVQLSSDDIKIGEPEGATQGLAAMRDWAQRAHREVSVGRLFVHDGAVVAEELLSDGTVQASGFRVVRDQVTSVFRHRSLEEALAATDMTEADLRDD